MLGMLNTIDQQDFLQKKEHELQSARLLGKTECQKSGFCCYQRPATPTPDEVNQIAQYLNLTTETFIQKYLTIDKNRKDFSIYHFRFISKDYPETAGRFLENSETFNREPCIFLSKDRLCQIQDVKPRQCREHTCWLKKSGFVAENEWGNNILEINFGINGQEKEEESLKRNRWSQNMMVGFF